MVLLTLGILLFAFVHFIPSLAPALKTNALTRLGEGGYKGIFSLLLLGSFGLIIFGWRSVEPSAVYLPPPGLHKVALGLLALAFLLMAVSARNSRLKLLIRHPQLTGVALWGFSHLLLNGDNRSIVLFGGMLVWAVIEIFAINRREGVWIKTAPPSWGAEVVTLVIAAVTIAVVVYIHPWISGMPVW
ncbi:MAG: NnrU protein [Halioglobus sp.]|nr:NnrU protein [Halioglobus sp.]